MSGLVPAVSGALRPLGLDEVKARGVVNHVCRELVRRFGGQQVYVARGRVDVDELADKCCALKSQGLSTSAIAERFGVTVRRVQQLIKHGRRCAARSSAPDPGRGTLR